MIYVFQQLEDYQNFCFCQSSGYKRLFYYYLNLYFLIRLSIFQILTACFFKEVPAHSLCEAKHIIFSFQWLITQDKGQGPKHGYNAFHVFPPFHSAASPPTMACFPLNSLAIQNCYFITPYLCSSCFLCGNLYYNSKNPKDLRMLK